MSLKEKIETGFYFALIAGADAIKTKGHIVGYSSEVTGILCIAATYNSDDYKSFFGGIGLYVLGRACNNLRQKLKNEDAEIEQEIRSRKLEYLINNSPKTK